MIYREYDTGFSRPRVPQIITDIAIQCIVCFICRDYDDVAEERGLEDIVNSKPVSDSLLNSLCIKQLMSLEAEERKSKNGYNRKWERWRLSQF